MSAHAFQVFADYHQFYVWDAGMAPEDYTDEDIKRLVKVAESVVVVQPVGNMTVPVELEVWASDPGFQQSEWDHVAECALAVPTGRLQVHECMGGPVLNLSVTPGSYRVRVLFGGLGTLSEDGLEGADRYKITLWPGSPSPLRVVKQWHGEARAG